MTADFLLRTQNWLRWEISLNCYWNIDSLKQKLVFEYVMVPKNGQNILLIPYRLHFVSKKITKEPYWSKNNFFHPWKCIILSVVLPNSVLLAQMNLSHHIFKTQDSDPLSTSKWPSESQFCERWPYICHKNGQKWS